uniref:LRAT domain-containing protein n=1 Tax=Syphacia muris TaxID=451379 RepID=A0A0N5AKX5_9BILA
MPKAGGGGTAALHQMYSEFDLAYLSHSKCDYRAIIYCSFISSLEKCPKCQQIQQPNSSSDAEKSECTIQTPLTINLLPNPFISDTSCSVVLKPTKGTFKEFKTGDDLHIGIANSFGIVYSYWNNGITAETAAWSNAVSVCKLNQETTDKLLEEFIQQNWNKFSSQRYKSSTWNCFDFVSSFCEYAVSDFKNSAKSKLTVNHVQPMLQTVMRYCLLLKRVEANKGFYVLQSSS